MNPLLTNARLLWDESGAPYSVDYADIYYSRADALGESTHVFIEGNRLRERFAACGERGFTIGEIGFGAGLNFLNCCRAFGECAPADTTLHYLACELHPFTKSDLVRWLGHLPELATFSDAFVPQYPEHTAGVHQLTLGLPRHRIQLTLLYGDARECLSDYGNTTTVQVDAWLLDGFSPKQNPLLWQDALLRQVARLSHAQTTLSSYSVAAAFKHALTASGFSYEKTTGYRGKRHMLKASFTGTISTKLAPARQHAVIIGGGISGCSTAFALAESGWKVTLLESAATLATQGSGNLQGVLHCKPGTAETHDNHFNLHAYLFAQRHYSALAKRGLPWHQCGMLHVGIDSEQARRFERIVACGRFHPSILQLLDAQAASELAGVALTHPCLHFPLSGWLSPAELCAFYVQHERIEVVTNAEVNSLQPQENLWRVETASGLSVSAGVVVISNAAAAYDFPICQHLPFISNRGQVDVYESQPASNIKTVLCGQGYLTPAYGGRQSLGGSYYVEASSEEQNRLTHLKLLGRMDRSLAQQLSTRRPLEHRVGQRCQTPDRMPLAGLVTLAAAGLYLNAAHGSNGLARTPICAALLTSMINNTPAPLPDTLSRLVLPTRFG